MKRLMLFLGIILISGVCLADNEVNILDRNAKRVSPLENGSALSSGVTSSSGTSAVVLGSSLTITQVQIEPLTGFIWVGGSNVTIGNGLQVASGSVVTIYVDNLSDVYFAGEKGTNTVRYLAFTK